MLILFFYYFILEITWFFTIKIKIDSNVLSLMFKNRYNNKRFITSIFDKMMQLPNYSFDLELSDDLLEKSYVPSLKHSCQDILIQNLGFNVYSTIGNRQQNLDKFSYLFHQQFQIFGLFDGHGDQSISSYLSTTLIQKIVNHSRFSIDFDLALRQSFFEVQNEVKHISYNSGSTALVVFIKGQIITVANIGDSLAVGVGLNNEAFPLNQLHNLQNKEELRKVQQKGGILIRQGKTYRINGQLTLSRSIGDQSYKDVMCSQVEIRKYNKRDFSKILLVSDGIWNWKNITGKLNRQQLNMVVKKVDEIIEKKHIGYFKDNSTFISLKL